MNVFRYRSAVAPLKRLAQAQAAELPSVRETVLAERPDQPLHCLRPQVVAATARRFVALFPGDVLYAVKCNPEPALLGALAAGGISHFDAASLAEVRLVRAQVPGARVHFMHPVKSRTAIRAAYGECGVRDFAIDSAEELAKVTTEVPDPAELGLVVRLALPKGDACYDLSGKFGAAPAEAAALLMAARSLGARVGLSFHVGSQCLDPAAYERALELVGRVLSLARVPLDILDVGGGFPVSYADCTPPALESFMAAIRRGIARLPLPEHCRLWCEPGRALAAPGQSVVVRVLARRGHALYINDGIYGALSDAGPAVGLRFPVRPIRADGGECQGALVPFELFGPTCDSADRMKGPFLLPADIAEGDWIEIGQLGAYGTALRTGFNGFEEATLVAVRDRPLLETPGHAAAVVRAA